MSFLPIFNQIYFKVMRGVSFQLPPDIHPDLLHSLTPVHLAGQWPTTRLGLEPKFDLYCCKFVFGIFIALPVIAQEMVESVGKVQVLIPSAQNRLHLNSQCCIKCCKLTTLFHCHKFCTWPIHRLSLC